MDLDTAGAAANAGLMGAAMEKPAGRAGKHHGRCTDCGAETIGRFCHECGQPTHVHRTLLHLGEEMLHGVMHFDGRVWRTLPMLFFRPGTLTRNWVNGKRTRYVSPLAVFLFTVFIIFMTLSFMPAASPTTIGQAQTQMAAELARETEALRGAERVLAAAPPKRRAEAQRTVDAASRKVAETQQRMDGLKRVEGLGITTGDWQAELAASARSGELALDVGSDQFNKKLEKAFQNPEYAIYKLQQSFYKFSFLLVPISIPFVALLFLWKRGFTLYDHGVFVLYSLSFVSALLLAFTLTLGLGGGLAAAVAGILPFAIPLHMYFQLKGAYGLGVFSAAWRTVALLLFANVALGVFIATVVWLGFA